MSSYSSSKKDKPSAGITSPDWLEETESVANLYDRLLETEVQKVAQDNLTIHKRLHFSREEQEKGIIDSNDWIRANIEIPATAHLLDAGCGVGGSLFALLNESRTGLGITLSRKQVVVAQQEADRRGVSERCRFRQQSYDAPLGERFDFILSIESLAHSQQLTASVANLARHLRPEGYIFLLEDMASSNLDDHKLALILRQSWCLQTLYTRQHYRDVLADAGLHIVKTVDMTPNVQFKPWPTSFIQLVWRLINKLPASWRGTKDVFVGGWALENLYRNGFMKYQAFLAKKA